MSSILVGYNELKQQINIAVRRYLSAMAERETAGLLGVERSNVQEALSDFQGDLIPRSIAHVTFEGDIAASEVIGQDYHIAPDDIELNKFNIITGSGQIYTTIIPTKAFESLSDPEYSAWIKKYYDEKLLQRAIALRENEEETLRTALEQRLNSFDELIDALQTEEGE